MVRAQCSRRTVKHRWLIRLALLLEITEQLDPRSDPYPPQGSSVESSLLSTECLADPWDDSTTFQPTSPVNKTYGGTPNQINHHLLLPSEDRHGSHPPATASPYDSRHNPYYEGEQYDIDGKSTVFETYHETPLIDSTSIIVGDNPTAWSPLWSLPSAGKRCWT